MSAPPEAGRSVGNASPPRDGGAASDGGSAPAAAVSPAFCLGWNMCVLFLSGSTSDGGARMSLPARLPSPKRFSNDERSLIWLKQIEGTVAYFGHRFEVADEDMRSLATIGRKAGALIERGEKLEAVRWLLHNAHMLLAQALSANDARLAKAYHLGVSLAATCQVPSEFTDLEREFDRERIAQLGESLADLASLFPDHASRSVRLSCNAWQRWVEDPQVNPVDAECAKERSEGRLDRIEQRAKAWRADEVELDWSKAGPDVQRALVRQGEVWRALLADEKSGTEMLELSDYVSAAVRAVGRGARLLPVVAFPLLVGVVGLIVGVLLLTSKDGTGTDLAGLVAVLGSLGIGWKGVLGTLAALAARLQQPVWGAALDQEIAEAITKLPTGAVPIWEEPEEAAPAAGPQPHLLPIQDEIDAGQKATA